MSMNWAKIVQILLVHTTSTSNLLIQGVHGYFKTTLIVTLTALTDPKLAWQNEFPVFHRHVHSQFCQDGSAVPTLQGVLHMEACWQKPTSLQLNLTGWSLWGGSMIVTSSLDSARGLFSDYGRARCIGGGNQGFVVLVNYRLQTWLQLWSCNREQVAGLTSQAMSGTLMRHTSVLLSTAAWGHSVFIKLLRLTEQEKKHILWKKRT